LRGCGTQVQEAAEQRVVMKTITCSNIRGGIAANRLFRITKHCDSRLFHLRSALLV
jgi:hypothetical protein